ncbi:MAG: flavodoxin family protein [Bacteroidales bacterium]|nr:flavodoxin family protein [Bacteroidales bacterium]
MKKVLIICGSPRKDGNSDILAQQFAKGAEEAGHSVETIYIRDLKLGYCIGCMSCIKTGKCFQQDDANSIHPKMLEADVICFSSPVYYYSVSAQLKTFIDRMNPLYGRMKDKDFYYMITAAENDNAQIGRAFDAMEGFADCFDNIRRCGRVYGGGASDKGAIRETSAFDEAYKMGKNI